MHLDRALLRKEDSMLKVGQKIMYRRMVCTVKDVVKSYREGQDYYKLAPCYDETLVIHAPVEGCEKLYRPLISKSEVEELIRLIPETEVIEADSRTLENAYKDLFSSEKHLDLVKIIKTAYIRGEEKLEKGQARSEKDKIFFRKAEDALYCELAVVLGKTIDETREYVVERVAGLVV